MENQWIRVNERSFAEEIMQSTQNNRRRRRRHSKRYKRRVRQLMIRFGLIVGIIVCIMFAIFGRKDKKDDAVEANNVIEDTEKKAKQEKKEEKKDKKEFAIAPVIVLDAGHGGKDSGTIWEEDYEKAINLSIMLKVAGMLEEEGFTVVCTRQTDTECSLDERIEIARRNQADVFVSIHQNAVEEDTTSHGIETFCNEDKNAGSPELAKAIQRAVIGQTQAKDRELNTKSDLMVVQPKEYPSCLIETGFMTSDEERRLLMSKEYQKKLASGIVTGIKEYLQEYGEVNTQIRVKEPVSE